jgi:hypothetical protein
MGLFAKFKAGLAKTHAKLTHELKRIVTGYPKPPLVCWIKLNSAVSVAGPFFLN